MILCGRCRRGGPYWNEAVSIALNSEHSHLLCLYGTQYYHSIFSTKMESLHIVLYEAAHEDVGPQWPV